MAADPEVEPLAREGRRVTRTTRIFAKAAAQHQRVKAYAFESKDPPADIQLWNVGDNPTDYGVHKWTDRSQTEVVARYNERGNPLLIDVEHNGATVDGEATETGGYARLELREGAPWLVFDWSAYALEQIATRQRLFLSPEYDVDADTNEITKLYRVSLVADPGTHRARILAAALSSNATEGNQMDPTLSAIMALLDSVSDPAAAIDAVRGFVAALPGAEAAPPVDEAVLTDAPPPAKADDKPAFAAAGDGDDDKKKVEAAAPSTAAAAASAPVAAPAAAVVVAASAVIETESVKAARAHAVQSENALRDMILLQDGHRLAPSVRTWASSQPLAVVRGLVGAAPEAQTPPARVSATRGAGHGTGTVRVGLQGADLEELQRGMGTFKATAPNEPYTKPNGDFVLPTITPTEHRRMQAAAAAKGGAK
jgi:Mu-like prophage I protein